MIVPDDLVVAVAAAKANADLGTSLLTQAALATFIDNGAMDRHLRRTRTHYRRRRDTLIDSLRNAPNIHISGIAAGVHVLVSLPTSIDVEAVSQEAQTLGFAARPLARYRHRTGPAGIVLGYAALQPPALRTATRALVTTIRAMATS